MRQGTPPLPPGSGSQPPLVLLSVPAHPAPPTPRDHSILPQHLLSSELPERPFCKPCCVFLFFSLVVSNLCNKSSGSLQIRAQLALLGVTRSHILHKIHTQGAHADCFEVRGCPGVWGHPYRRDYGTFRVTQWPINSSFAWPRPVVPREKGKLRKSVVRTDTQSRALCFTITALASCPAHSAELSACLSLRSLLPGKVKAPSSLRSEHRAALLGSTCS